MSKVKSNWRCAVNGCLGVPGNMNAMCASISDYNDDCLANACRECPHKILKPGVIIKPKVKPKLKPKLSAKTMSDAPNFNIDVVIDYTCSVSQEQPEVELKPEPIAAPDPEPIIVNAPTAPAHEFNYPALLFSEFVDCAGFESELLVNRIGNIKTKDSFNYRGKIDKKGNELKIKENDIGDATVYFSGKTHRLANLILMTFDSKNYRDGMKCRIINTDDRMNCGINNLVWDEKCRGNKAKSEPSQQQKAKDVVTDKPKPRAFTIPMGGLKITKKNKGFNYAW